MWVGATMTSYPPAVASAHTMEFFMQELDIMIIQLKTMESMTSGKTNPLIQPTMELIRQ